MRTDHQLRNVKNAFQLAVLFGIILGGAASQSSAQISIMPLGDSITRGNPSPDSGVGGYRDPLYTDLASAGVSFSFVGANNASATTLLTTNNDQYHNGYGSYQIADITNNLNGNSQPAGDPNLGGYWLTGNHGTGRSAVSPNIVLLEIGANNFALNPGESMASDEQDLQTLLTTFHGLSPKSIILVGGAIPGNNISTQAATYDAYIKNTLVPSLSYTRYVDIYDGFVNADGSQNTSLYIGDNLHPNSAGYAVMANEWAPAIEVAAASVPEPSAWALDAMGLCGLVLWGSRARLPKLGRRAVGIM